MSHPFLSFNPSLQIQDGQDYSEERAYATLSAQMAKQTAREMLVHSLPVRDDALVQRLEALVQVGSNAKHRKNIEERRNEALRTKRQDMHASYMTVLTTIQHQTGGRELNPLELSAHVNNTYLAQRQQQMMAQQAQQAAHMPPPQPGQPMQPQQQQQQPAQQQQQQPGQPGAPAPAAGQPAPAHGTPAGPPAVGMPGGVPGAPMGPPSGGALPGLPPAAGMQMPGSKPGQTPQISLHQLNTILASNKLPNGQELTDEMRQAIEKKRQLFLQHVQQQQRQQGTPGAAPGVPPGQPGMQPPMQGGPKVPGQAPGPSAASLAAMQASQQAAAIQAVTRPPLPPGVFGVPPGAGIALPPGAPGQPVSLPPGMQGIPGMGQQMTSMAQPGMPLPAGVSAAQLTGASAAMAMPGVQPGLVLPPGQHLLAQQMMQQQAVQQAQQQQAAAAAAAAAAQTKPAQ